MKELSMTVYLIFAFATVLVVGLWGGLRKGFITRKVTSFKEGFIEGFSHSAAIWAVIETIGFIYFWFTFWGKM